MLSQCEVGSVCGIVPRASALARLVERQAEIWMRYRACAFVDVRQHSKYNTSMFVALSMSNQTHLHDGDTSGCDRSDLNSFGTTLVGRKCSDVDA